MKPTIKNLEEQAEQFWQIMLDSGLSDGYCKSYDPLTIKKDEQGYSFLSYIFDYEDGARSRYFNTLEAGQIWLLKSFRQWLDDSYINERVAPNLAGNNNDKLTIQSLFTELEGIIGEDLPLGSTTGVDRRIRKAINYDRETIKPKLQDLKKKYGVE